MFPWGTEVNIIFMCKEDLSVGRSKSESNIELFLVQYILCRMKLLSYECFMYRILVKYLKYMFEIYLSNLIMGQCNPETDHILSYFIQNYFDNVKINQSTSCFGKSLSISYIFEHIRNFTFLEIYIYLYIYIYICY